MATNESFSTLYRISITLVTSKEVITIPTSDIITLSVINNYDTMTHAMVRLRLYSDISIVKKLTDDTDNISIRCNIDGGIYNMNSDEKSPTLVSSSGSISFQWKVYIENKNTPASDYISQIDDSSLNSEVKVPLELYCYNEKVIHNLQQEVKSVYKNMSISSITHDILNQSNIGQYQIDHIENNIKYDQVLIPNLDVTEALSFFNSKYGLYKKGGQMFVDFDKLYISDTNVNNKTTPLPIYVESYKNNTDMVGMKKINNKYYMNTLSQNVSVLSETNIEKTLNANNINSVNVDSLSSRNEVLKKLYNTNDMMGDIRTPDILHKSENKFISSEQVARINERLTEMDISGTGFDITKMKVNTRYNVIFASPIRGANINEFYRAKYTCHVFSNLDMNLFTVQTTMSLCSN